MSLPGCRHQRQDLNNACYLKGQVFHVKKDVTSRVVTSVLEARQTIGEGVQDEATVSFDEVVEVTDGNKLALA